MVIPARTNIARTNTEIEEFGVFQEKAVSVSPELKREPQTEVSLVHNHQNQESDENGISAQKSVDSKTPNHCRTLRFSR